MRALFVTGSGTGVGKTFTVCALIREIRSRGRRVEALKPVASGFDPAAPGESDTGRILAALGRPLDAEGIEAVSPWRFAAPLSPDMAAAREARRIDLDGVVALCRERLGGGAEVLLIEGIGGVMVPLTDRHTVLDWIAALEVPALLVVGSYLGTLSHTLTAAAALRSRGVSARVLVSESERSPVPLDETVAALRRHLPDGLVTSCPRSGAGAPALGELAAQILEAPEPSGR